MKLPGPLRFALLASGTGSNVAAILGAWRDGRLGPAEPRVVVANVEGAAVLDQARAFGVPSLVVAHRVYRERDEFERELVETIRAHGADWVFLAGFMRLLGVRFLQAFPDRVVNIHPALLPSFPGTHAQRQALAYGVKVSGCTVHFVNEGVDSGPIIAQATVPVLTEDDEASLAARILVEEHELYPQVIRWLAEGRVHRKDRRVLIDHS